MSTNKKKCVACRQREVVSCVHSIDETVSHDGQSYHVHLDNAKMSKCLNCGNTILDDETIDELYSKMRMLAGLLQPYEIKQIRQKFGLTQKEFSSYLGVAESTLCRWETGSQIQQKSLNKMLVAFDSEPRVRHIFSDGKFTEPSHISTTQTKEIFAAAESE
ncbi:MAG: type II toxin-antitoxin system MqsA family antitoxin [Gemmataceae bacterium]